MKNFGWLWRGIAMSLVFTACNLQEEISSSDPSAETLIVSDISANSLIPSACSSSSWTLWAGQTINAGTLTVSNDNDNLYVTYTAAAGNTFGTLHLWVGNDLLNVPSTQNGPNAGTPIPGQFPYHYDTNGGTEYTFTLALSNLTGWNGCDKTSFYVVAHAEMQVSDGNGGTSGQTAFGGDTNGSGPRWWYYASYGVQCCDNPPPAPSEKYGTAFVKGGYVFTTDKKSNPENLPSLSLTKNRWGWAINLKAAGTTTYDIWNGAGLNNTSKGKKVGTATVVYTSTQVTVTMIYFDGLTFEEAHIYAGDFKPTTLAPGQYGYTEYYDPFASTDTYTFDVSDSNGDGIWLIVHSIAYGPAMTNP